MPQLLQFCDLCHSLRVHQATIQRYKLPIYTRHRVLIQAVISVYYNANYHQSCLNEAPTTLSSHTLHGGLIPAIVSIYLLHHKLPSELSERGHNCVVSPYTTRGFNTGHCDYLFTTPQIAIRVVRTRPQLCCLPIHYTVVQHRPL